MSDVPYTKKRSVTWRGPSSSEDYNARIKENYEDLTVLFNRMRLSEVEVDELYARVVKDQEGLTRKLDELEQRAQALESGRDRMIFHHGRELSYFDNLAGTEGLDQYFIPEDQRLELDPTHGILTLTRSEQGSLSKLRFTNDQGEETLPPGLDMRVVGDPTTADNPGSFHDSSSPLLALYRKPGLVWERNVVTSAPNANGAALTVYVKVSQDLFSTDDANVLIIHPFPVFGTTIAEIAYSTRVDITMSDADNYQAFNPNHYAGEAGARDWVVPGGWTGADAGNDTIVDASPRRFIFPPKPVTGLRIRLEQDRWLKEAGDYIYSYGLSNLDLRYDKFVNAEQGASAYIRFNAPVGRTISGVDAVTPQIYNASPARLNDVFDYEVVWESGAGVPTSTPVANSSHVWIKVTLKGTPGYSPSLSGLVVDYH